MSDDIKTKILLVDDEEDLLEAIGTFLLSKGFSVATALNGLEALSAVDKEHFDLIVSDVRMPKFTGIDFLKALPARNKMNIPVVLISGFSETTVPEALGLGALDLLAKPFDFDTLSKAIKKAQSFAGFEWNEDLKSLDDCSFFEYCFSSIHTDSLFPTFFGRGGVFIPMSDDFPNSFEMCRFSFKKQDDNNFEFMGHGIVRWVRRQENDFLSTGIGVEIRSLTPRSKEYLKSELKNRAIVSYIPQGNKNI